MIIMKDIDSSIKFWDTVLSNALNLAWTSWVIKIFYKTQIASPGCPNSDNLRLSNDAMRSMIFNTTVLRWYIAT